MQQRPLLVVVDGHSLLYRAYHGLPNTLATRSGEPTNAVYGFTTMLLSVLKERKPSCVVVTMDAGRSFRHDDYDGYKANRPVTPDDFRPQVARACQVLEAMRIPVFAEPGWEADDLIGTLSAQAVAQGADVLIVSGDSDAFQLINDHVQVLTSGRRFSDTVVYDTETVHQRYGLEPRQLIDYKALLGDKSDNVPGVKGIGEKTASSLLAQYGSVEGVYEHLDEISSSRVREALAAGRDEAVRSKYLVTIRQDVPVSLDLSACRVGQSDSRRLTEIFQELDFRNLMDRVVDMGRQGQLSLFAEAVPAAVVAPTAPVVATDVSYFTVVTRAELEALAEAIRSADYLAVDLESDSLDSISAGIVGMSLSVADGEAYYIPLGHRTPGEANADWNDVVELIGPVLTAAAPLKVAHNSKFDWELLIRHGLVPSGPDFDTMIGEWVLNPSSRALNLKGVAWDRLGVEMTPITDLIGTGKKQRCMADLPVSTVAPYAAADADMTLRLRQQMERGLRQGDQWGLFADIEMPLVPVLADMELTGVKIDVDYLHELARSLDERLLQTVEQIQILAGYPLNVNSTQQLSDFLFKHLGLPCVGLKKTASGHYSTAAEVLETLRGTHDVVDMILEQRQLAKLKSTYIDALPMLVNPRTGRVHTSYNQTATVTGRLSSSDPNLQNIPIRTELGRQVRRAFVAEPGNVLIGADYSQVELRILAHVSQDEAMLKAFADGLDIHASTAALTYGVPLEEVTPDMRRVAKTVNFAVVYGVSPYGLARQSDLNQREAEIFIRAYFQNYPRVRQYLDGIKAMAARVGYVETLLGRKRYFPELASGQRISQAQRGEAERAAINTPIQGTAADIIKIAMIRLHAELRRRNLRSRMILQVHDELVLEGPEGEAEVVAPLVHSVMEGAFALDAPLRADVSTGHNWLETK
ncbi:MAG: DNA polymerase I [Anaerolineae bacterium]